MKHFQLFYINITWDNFWDNLNWWEKQAIWNYILQIENSLSSEQIINYNIDYS